MDNISGYIGAYSTLHALRDFVETEFATKAATPVARATAYGYHVNQLRDGRSTLLFLLGYLAVPYMYR